VKQDVLLRLPFPVNTVIKLRLCNKYGVPFPLTRTELTLGVNSEILVSLEVNVGDTHWEVEGLVDNSVFWVYEGTEVQNVDLTTKLFPRQNIDILLSAPLLTAALNAERIIDRWDCGIFVESQEVQRFMCRYNDYVYGTTDSLLCKVDNKIGEKYV